MKAKITELTVQYDYTFTGRLYLEGVNLDVDITGEFDIQFSAAGHANFRRVYVEIAGCVVNETTHGDLIDFDDLTEQLQASDDGTFYEDYRNALKEEG